MCAHARHATPSVKTAPTKGAVHIAPLAVKGQNCFPAVTTQNMANARCVILLAATAPILVLVRDVHLVNQVSPSSRVRLELPIKLLEHALTVIAHALVSQTVVQSQNTSLTV